MLKEEDKTGVRTAHRLKQPNGSIWVRWTDDTGKEIGLEKDTCYISSARKKLLPIKNLLFLLY